MVKFIKILRVDVLVAEKALRDGKTTKQINDELAARLKMTYAALGMVKRTTNDKRVRADHLQVMADYFGVSINDVLNPAYLASKATAV